MQLRTDKQTHLEGIGPICIRKSVKAKNIRIRVNVEDGVLLIVPSHLPEKIAIKFALDKKNWIKNSLQKRHNLKEQLTIFDDTTVFTTRQRKLIIQKHSKPTIRSVVTSDKILVWYPDFAAVEDQRVQQAIRKTILESWRIEAKTYLPKRVKELAQQHNFKYNNLTIKNVKTRWGSCSSTNNINLNLQLMRLPDKLIDYVILHELVHTVEKNHQPPFWNQLERVLPGARRLDKELNRFHLSYW